MTMFWPRRGYDMTAQHARLTAGEQEQNDPGNLVLRAADEFNAKRVCRCPPDDCYSEANINLGVECRIGRKGFPCSGFKACTNIVEAEDEVCASCRASEPTGGCPGCGGSCQVACR